MTILGWIRRGILAALTGLVMASSPIGAGEANGTLRVVSGVTASGEATEKWLEILRRRLTDDEYKAVASLRRPLSAEEEAWADLIRSRLGAWKGEIPRLVRVFHPIEPPREALVVIGNRGAEDAFTHDALTMGFDLAALQANYGDADLAENAGRIDRFFRHEFVHLLQKAWLKAHPWTENTPLRTALRGIWAEGLGNYYSLSDRWLSREGARSEAAARALAALEPRFVARLAALACAAPEEAAAITTDLSSGRFDRKWGALPVALWIEGEREREGAAALRRFVREGPGGIWDLAGRHLPDRLRSVMDEVRQAASLCKESASPAGASEAGAPGHAGEEVPPGMSSNPVPFDDEKRASPEEEGSPPGRPWSVPSSRGPWPRALEQRALPRPLSGSGSRAS